jgi:hypothetical protein
MHPDQSVPEFTINACIAFAWMNPLIKFHFQGRKQGTSVAWLDGDSPVVRCCPSIFLINDEN